MTHAHLRPSRRRPLFPLLLLLPTALLLPVLLVVLLLLPTLTHAATGLSPEATSWAKVENLAAQVKAATSQRHLPLALAPRKHGSSFHLTEKNYKRNATLLSLAGHDHIVRVDLERRIIHAEAGVAMETLVRTAREYGLVPKVVAPFRKATVGGAVPGSAASSSSHRHGPFHDACSYLTVILGNGTVLIPSSLPPPKVSGSAASSSSHRHGSFHDSCSYLTVILGNGSVVTCSKKDNAELFHSMAGSQGTLGLVALVGVECEEAASTVRITYTRQASVDDGLSALKQACHYPTPPPSFPPSAAPQGGTETEGRREGGREGGRPDFVDAVLFREKGKEVGEVAGASQLIAEAVYDYFDDEAAAAAGAAEQEEGPSPHTFPEGTNLEDDVDLLFPPSSSSSSSLPPSLPPFYTGGRSSSDLFYSEHLGDVHSLLEKSGADSYVERMDLEDYLFRFDRGVFWLAQSAAASIPSIPFLQGWLFPLASRSLVPRFCWRWLFSSSSLFSLLHVATPDLLSSRLLLLAPSLPLSQASSFLPFLHTTLPLPPPAPLYLLPIRGAAVRQPFAPQGHIHTLFLSIYVYGRLTHGAAEGHTRRVEGWVGRKGGRKGLCAMNYYEKGVFWSGFPMYDWREYIYLRGKYAADGVFPSLEEKVCWEGGEGREGGREGGKGWVRRYFEGRRRKFVGMLL